MTALLCGLLPAVAQGRALDTVLVSRLGLHGAAGDGASRGPLGISADGRRIAFISGASNFPGAGARSGIFVKSLPHGTMELVSRADGREGAPLEPGPLAMSRNGRHVCWVSPDGRLYVRDVDRRTTRQVPGTAVPSHVDDERNGSLHPEQLSAPCAVSDDGRRVAYVTAEKHASGDGDTLPDVYLHDDRARAWTLLSDVDPTRPDEPPLGQARSPVMTPDGRYVAFWLRPGEPLARKPGLEEEPPVIGPEGFLVPGYANNSGLTIVVLRDTATGTATLVSRGPGCGSGAPIDRGPPPGARSPLGGAYMPSISDDGRFVAFKTRVPGLDPSVDEPPEDALQPSLVYVRDVKRCETRLVSRRSGPDGAPADAHSTMPSISPDGRRVAFVSTADNLDPEVTDEFLRRDVYVRDLRAGRTSLLSRASGAFGVAASGESTYPAAARRARVAFVSVADNLVAAGAGRPHVYHRDFLDRRGHLPADRPGRPGITASIAYRPGRAVTHLQLSEYARLRLRVTPFDGRPPRTYRRTAAEGANRLVVPGRLPAGRYRIELAATDFAGEAASLSRLFRLPRAARGTPMARALTRVAADAAPARFAGECDLEAVGEFTTAVGTAQFADGFVLDGVRGQSFCSGRLNDRPVTRTPMDLQVLAKGRVSCNAHAVSDLRVHLVFTRGTAMTGDDLILPLAGSGGGYVNRISGTLRGEAGGSAALHMSASRYASAQTVLEACPSNTLRRFGLSLRLDTLDELSGTPKSGEPLEVRLAVARDAVPAVLRRGLRVSLAANAPLTAHLLARRAGAQAGSRSAVLDRPTGGRVTVRLPLTAAARRALRTTSRPVVTVSTTATDVAGRTAVLRVRARLRR